MTQTAFINPKLLGVCPKCKEKEQVTIESRRTKEGFTRRRKECRACSHRATTYEVDEQFFVKARTILPKIDELVKLMGLKTQENICMKCVHNHNARCGFYLPEFDTEEARDCSFFEAHS